MENVIRDRNGNKIGVIKEEGFGLMVIRNQSGNKLGSYDPKDNITRNQLGNKVGTGNLLTSLLVKF